MRIVPVPCLKDNYAYLVIAGGGETAIVDASEAAPLRAAIRLEAVKVQALWSTHHHWDHVGGNEELAAELGVEVVGYVTDEGRIPGMTRGVESGEGMRLGDLSVSCIHIPGHTLGAVAYVVSSGAERAAFTGDTLFVAGCGRLFEGTPAQMHASLQRLAALPGETRVYCGHEYTESNLRFAASLEPDSADIARSRARAAKLRAEGKPTVGTTLAEEAKHNPFLRVRERGIRERLGVALDADDATAFAAIRAAKDAF